jgi:hypothetical protein
MEWFSRLIKEQAQAEGIEELRAPAWLRGHNHKLVRRLLEQCLPVCRRALSIRSAMAFLNGSKGRGQAPRRGDEAKVTMYGQYWALEGRGARQPWFWKASMWSRQLRHSMAFSCIGVLWCCEVSNEAGKAHGDRSPDHTRMARSGQGGCQLT